MMCGLLLCLLLLIPAAQADEQGVLANLPACHDLGFSTEEDFVIENGTQVVSDGDLLSRSGAVCARNFELLTPWQVKEDLGLDAVDIVIADMKPGLVAFSTELDDPRGRFGAGDLLATNGTAIPNSVLLQKFKTGYDMGLDGLQFIGSVQGIIGFLTATANISEAQWLADPGMLFEGLDKFKVDIWISTESTQYAPEAMQILDGDVLSVGTGAIVVQQANLLPLNVPAGLPVRGVDFGADALTANRNGDIHTLRFSTEILYRGNPAAAPFTDGDVLKMGNNGIETPNSSLIILFGPKARFLGLDALHINFADPDLDHDYLPSISTD